MPNPQPPRPAASPTSEPEPQFTSWWQTVTSRLKVTAGLVGYYAALGALNYPIFLRILFAFLRPTRPIAVILGSYYVARHADVSSVLRRSGDFTVHDALAPGMSWGPFLLTIDWPDVHARDRDFLRSFAERGDVARIDRLVRTRCEAALEAARGDSGDVRIDFASAYAEPAVLGVIETYFGIPPLDGDAATMARALRLLSSHVMAQAPIGSDMRSDTDRAIGALTLHVSGAVSDAVRRAREGRLAPGPDSTMLERMAARFVAPGSPSWFTEDWMRRFLTGLLATAAGTMVRAAAHTLDRLMADGDGMAATRRAALALSDDITAGRPHYPSPAPGDGSQHAFDATSRGVFEQHLLEALRFRPMLPLLVRHCPRDVILGEGSKHERTIPGGTSIKVGLMSGMFDRDIFDNPRRFRSGRSGAAYLHFGYGPRYCFGTYVARTVIGEMLRLVLIRGVPQRVTGPTGKPVYEAAAVKHLEITIAQRTEA